NAPDEARAVIEDVLRTAVSLGYRHVEAVARRLLAAAVATVDVARASEELDAAETILRERNARNELGKAWVVRACLARPVPDRPLLEQALALFRELGTVDEPLRVERLLGHADR